MEDRITLEDLIEARRVLDKAGVPEEERLIYDELQNRVIRLEDWPTDKRIWVKSLEDNNGAGNN